MAQNSDEFIGGARLVKSDFLTVTVSQMTKLPLHTPKFKETSISSPFPVNI